MVKKTKKEDKQRSSNLSSYALFTKEYYSNRGNLKSVEKGNTSVKKARDKLPEKKREEYRSRAKDLRAPAKCNKYMVPFHTRCVPNQFMNVCEELKSRKDLMGRLKRIGFDRLVEVCCLKISRDVYREFMLAFDTPTKKISIRGKSRIMTAEDVQKFMGIPHFGEEIKPNVDKESQSFKDLRSVYGKVPYKTLGSWLIDKKQNPNFEFQFVMYAVGTLLCPMSSVEVSDRLLKVMLSTMDSLDKYDWSSYVFNELCKSIEEYKDEVRKGKVSRRKNVGGCLYFLMVSVTEDYFL